VRPTLLALLLLSATLPARAEPIRVDPTARSIQPGELVVLTVTGVPDIVDDVRATGLGREAAAFRVGPQRWRILFGIDLDTKPGTHSISIERRSNSSQLASYTIRVEPKQFATRTLRVDQAYVTPPRATLERIEQEAAALRALLSNTSPERLWSGPFLAPVPGPSTSSFGTRTIFNGERRAPHGGADFVSPAGTPIKAPNGGIVLLARDQYFTGNTVVLDHGLGLFSVLAHLSRLEVREGETVAAGDIVGRVGATGRVTGPHLHWAVRAAGARVDPLSVLEVLGRIER
jgi:murein DD-endopeptidase MepM/ murein hydrolase activator NlpD